MEQQNNKENTTEKKQKKSKKRILLVVAYIILVIIFMFIKLRGDYLNILEIGENYIDIFNKNLQYTYGVMLVNFIIVFLSLYITTVFIKKGLKVFFKEDNKEMPKLPNKSISLVLATVISILTSSTITEKVVLSLNGTLFGINDPIFNMDVGYYIFQKPFIELAIYYFMILFVILAIYTAIYYIAVFNIYFDGINSETLKKSMFIKQISVFAIIIAITIAGITFVKTQDILFEKFLGSALDSETVIYGAGLTDVTIKLWGYRILAIIIPIAVIFAVINFRKLNNKKAVISLCTIPAYLIVLFIVMTGFQFIFVKPNELDKERAYIEENIKSTKKAYNIEINENLIENYDTITKEQVDSNIDLINNISVVNKDITLKTLREYQTNTGYYTYRDTNLAKYNINGKDKILYLTPREVNAEEGRTYNSKTYQYTHGYGAILSSATTTNANGNIEYIQKEVDQKDEVVDINQPRIYFGLDTNNTIMTNLKNKKEFDYPINSTTNQENVYDGNAGLKLNFIDRLVLGIRNGDLKLAFNTEMTDETKIITNRNIIQRAKVLMPYLKYDENPYMVITDDGRLVWILDAYTITNNYPYSQETLIEIDGVKTRINYIRNSVKVLINAYDGTMKFYITDTTDPIILAYQKIYPTLFVSNEEEIPDDIKEHIVYPKFLYDIQAEMLTRYHNVQTEVLYRNDDVWDIARTNTSSTLKNVGTQMDSYYTIVKTIDSLENQLGLVIPYTPDEKQNIISYLVGTYDGNNKLSLYKFKSDSNVLGIMQLDNQIEVDDTISKELDTINTTGSKIVKEMYIVPFNNTILYVEPIYQLVLNNETQIPVLKKVIVASGNRVAIGDDLNKAISNLLSQESLEIDVQNTDTQDGLINEIIKANNNLQESSNNNDWELIGRDLARLQELIEKLEKLKEDEAKDEEKIGTDIENVIETNTINDNIIVEE